MSSTPTYDATPDHNARRQDYEHWMNVDEDSPVPSPPLSPSAQIPIPTNQQALLRLQQIQEKLVEIATKLEKVMEELQEMNDEVRGKEDENEEVEGG